jgi:purine-binding chemotaxis protein CheW
VNGIHVRVRAGGEEYALPVDCVLEVTEVGEVRPVPGAPAELLGVCNLRGQVLPVIDLARLLALDRTDEIRRIVVAEDGAIRTGLAVDGVVDVGPLPEPSEEAESEYLRGATLVDGTLVGVLDLPAVVGRLSTEVTGR